MNFQVLQQRLVGNIRKRVRDGELTERGLARLSGVSQPHIHNVLKGVRVLSPEFADLVLRELNIDVLDLIDKTELRFRPGSAAVDPDSILWVPRLAGAIGPAHRWPQAHASEAPYPMLARAVGGLTQPAIASLGNDPRMCPRFREGDTLLLDFAEIPRLHPDPDSAYVVEHGGGSLVRFLRRGCGRLYLIAEDVLEDREKWDCVSIPDRNILNIVRARIVWMGRRMEP